jgi:hypothetical protein
MKRTALAVLVALSLPAVAAADVRPERHPEHFAPPPVAAPVREDAALRRLVARYLAALERPGERRRLAGLEAEVGRAIERELAQARARLPGRSEPWARGARHGAATEARAQVARLVSLRDEFGRLQGRFGRRAVERKEALARELVVVAALESRRPGLAGLAGLAGPALAWRDGR